MLGNGICLGLVIEYLVNPDGSCGRHVSDPCDICGKSQINLVSLARQGFSNQQTGHCPATKPCRIRCKESGAVPPTSTFNALGGVQQFVETNSVARLVSLPVRQNEFVTLLPCKLMPQCDGRAELENAYRNTQTGDYCARPVFSGARADCRYHFDGRDSDAGWHDGSPRESKGFAGLCIKMRSCAAQPGLR